MFLKLIIVIMILQYLCAAQISVCSKCDLPHSMEKGVGTLLEDCPKFMEIYYPSNMTRPDNYAFISFPSIICCTVRAADANSILPAANEISKRVQKCNDYAKSVFDEIEVLSLVEDGTIKKRRDTCSINSIPLVIGPQALPREFPHYTLLGYNGENPNDDDNIEWLCGGSLVSLRFVLTAAQCLQMRANGPVKIARLGNFNDDHYQTDILVEQIIPHPDFISTKSYHDIGLIKLAEKVKFSQFIRPICLPTSNEFTEEKLIESGWDFHPILHGEKKQLLRNTVHVITNEECNTFFQSILTRSLPNGIIDKQICMRYDWKPDFCIGDILQLYNRDTYCMYTQIGVASLGTSCEGGAKMYTRVFGYSDWISGIIWGPGEDD